MLRIPQGRDGGKQKHPSLRDKELTVCISIQYFFYEALAIFFCRSLNGKGNNI